MKVILGRVGDKSETVRIIKHFPDAYTTDMNIDIELHHYDSVSYVRIEGFTERAGGNDADVDSVTQTLYGFKHL